MLAGLGQMITELRWPARPRGAAAARPPRPLAAAASNLVMI